MKKFSVLVCLSLLLSVVASAETVVIPSVVHSPGANGAFWKTAIGIYNSSETVQTISARNIVSAGEIPAAELQPKQFVGTDDLGALFNSGDGTFLVEMTTSSPSVLFTARTYSMTEGQLGQFSTLLLPVSPITNPLNLVFTRTEGARKALFLYGDLTASCLTGTDTIYVYYGTIGTLTRMALPDSTYVCQVTNLFSGFPSGGSPSDFYAYAWASEADNISNCPTLIIGE